MVVKFEVYSDGEQWCARGVGTDIFTCAETLDDLVAEVKDAAVCHYADELRNGRPLNLLLLTESEIVSGAQTAAG